MRNVVLAVMVLFVSSLGCSHSAPPVEKESECEKQIAIVLATPGGQPESVMDQKLWDAQKVCGAPAQKAKLEQAKVTVAARHKKEFEAKMAEERAAEAKLDADAEKHAVETFPEKKKQVLEAITAAKATAAAGKPEQAKTDLEAAWKQLAELKGTSVEKLPEYTDLRRQILEAQKTFQPQLDKLAEARNKQEDLEAEKRKRDRAMKDGAP